MFNQKERTFAVLQTVEQDTALGKQPVTSFFKEIKARVFTRAGNTATSNNVKITNSTHIALTSDKSIKPDMQLTDDVETYTVDFVINDAPLAQLFLKQVI